MTIHETQESEKKKRAIKDDQDALVEYSYKSYPREDLLWEISCSIFNCLKVQNLKNRLNVGHKLFTLLSPQQQQTSTKTVLFIAAVIITGFVSHL